jgi:hypothetical protein
MGRTHCRDEEGNFIDVHVMRLRRKLGAAGGQLETVRGRGLCLHTAWVLVHLRTAGCGELAVVPLIGLVSCVFLAGVLPFAAPLGLNAAGFALILFAWSVHDARACERPAAQAVEGRSSVKGPGIPRTNPDGSWPRRP